MAESPNQDRPPQVYWQLQVILIGIAVVLLGFFLMYLQGVDPAAKRVIIDSSKPKKFTRDETQELLLLRDRANAHLENLQFQQADDLFREIIRLLPDEPLGHRNLSICRELAAGNESDPEKRRLVIEGAQQAVDRLMQVDPKSYISHVLAARVFNRLEDVERAETALRRAVELNPQSAPALYDLVSLKPSAPGELPGQETRDNLRKLHELQPDNLFLLKDWLVLQVMLRAPDASQTVRETRDLVAPYFGVIKQHMNLDVEKMLNDLTAAVEAQEWKMAERVTQGLRNILAPEALRDERYVKYNSLEYVQSDYGSAFYDRADLSDVGDKISIPVVFAPVDQRPALPAAATAIVAIDFDLDGQIDGATLQQGRVDVAFPLWVKEGGSPPVTSTIEVAGDFLGLVAVDLDDDKDSLIEAIRKQSGGGQYTDPDLILYGPSGVKLFENRIQENSKTREFREHPSDSVLGSVRDVTALTPGDFDLDGDLDFLTISSDGIRIWSNRGNWTFEEITSRSRLPSVEFAPTSAVIVDWDRDTDLDIVVAGTTGVGILENIHHGRFRWREPSAELTSLAGVLSVIVDELDGNGSWDLVGTGPEGLSVVLTKTSAAGLVSPIKITKPSTAPAAKVTSLDLDNDGRRDLLVQGEGSVYAVRGLDGGGFEPFNLGLSDSKNLKASIVVVDVDHDGDEDLVRSTQDAIDWVSNEGGNANGWLNVTLTTDKYRPGEQNYSKRVNHAGIGSAIEVRVGTRYQAQVVKGASSHFGLGAAQKADVTRVLWTNGIPRNLIDAERNSDVVEELKLYGSCPYLYTWDGEKFVFYTDLLWNAPLGLKFAENVIAPWREWEYLKIDGDKLRDKAGEYLLNVTAELWEVEYFDQIKLFAMDHPEGAQVFTNEKVGPPSMAEPAIHTVRQPRLPVAARDTLGRDVLDQIKLRDGVCTKTYEVKLKQGLTTDHFLELDLGNWNTASETRGADSGSSSTTGTSGVVESTAKSQVMLYLTGWMYPATTSLNVQFSQNPDGPKPRPPSLHAVDANGQWREVRPFMGFPGGKTKTIAVDISDVFAPGTADHRLRIVTNMQFYWDAAFFTVDDEPVSIRQLELPLVRAVLRDRGGVSLRRWPLTGNGPEIFDYHKLVPGEMWAPIEGAFTRYGDVRSLLAGRDDHLVVMHPGDEIQLAFAGAGDPIPAGWTRDFVIYNVGWDKDCDLNTVYGETVEPMPFRDMTVYGEPRPVDDEYVRYLKEYQTRVRPRGPYWNQLRRN